MAAALAIHDTYTVSHVPDASGGQTGAIRIIKGDGSSVFVPTNTLFNDEEKSVRENTDDGGFMEYQNRLRLLDIFKDAETRSADPVKIDAHKICDLFLRLPTVQCPDGHSQSKGLLHMLRHRLLSSDVMKHKIVRASLVKQNAHYQYLSLLPTRLVFQESGLHPAHMILNPIRCHTFASQVIDPADREGYVAGDEVFPRAGESLVMDESFLRFFGFENCSIAVKRIDNNTHEYRIYVNGVSITHDSHQFHVSGSTTIDYFCGNSIKNHTVNEKYDSANANGRLKLAALLVSKEMGDVVQVLIAFIYQSLYPNRSYTITTCDMVVFMLCLLLNVKCIVVGHIGSEQDPTDKSYSSLRFEKFTNQHKYDSIIAQIETLIDMNQVKINSLELRLPLLGLYRGEQPIPTHRVYDIRHPEKEDSRNFVKPEFIEFVVRDLKSIQAVALQIKNMPGFIPTPEGFGVLPDGVNSEGANNYHATLSQIYKSFEEQFSILPLVTYDNERAIYVLTIGSSYTQVVPPGVVNYTLPNYDPVNGKSLSSIMREFNVPPSPSIVLGKSARVSKSVTPYTVKAIRAAIKKSIGKKMSQKTGGTLRSSVRKSVRKSSKKSMSTTRPSVRRSVRKSVRRSVRKSVRKSMSPSRDTLINPFVIDFYPVYYQYWTDQPGDLGEELENDLDTTSKSLNSKSVNSKNKRTWKSVDIHAVLKNQVNKYLSKMGALAKQYRMSILSAMYDDFRVHEHTLFGKELEKRLRKIMKELIIPYHQAAQKEEKYRMSLIKEESILQKSLISVRPTLDSKSSMMKKQSPNYQSIQKRGRENVTLLAV